tara:strand:- start:812 stop:1417 length:606 start_codon:yes stop_codon:yes gene_type:complete
MFTGIVTNVGHVQSIEKSGDTRILIRSSFDMTSIRIGSSVACSGPCLTVVEKGEDWFAVEASAETLARTNIGLWVAGTPVNLERSLRIGDELGGHIVTGHVDGIAKVIDSYVEGDSLRMEFQLGSDFRKFIAVKGSVALDGVSLTINSVEGDSFWVNIISHTQRETTFSFTRPGDSVNVEVDVIARYVARLKEFRSDVPER